MAMLVSRDVCKACMRPFLTQFFAGWYCPLPPLTAAISYLNAIGTVQHLTVDSVVLHGCDCYWVTGRPNGYFQKDRPLALVMWETWKNKPTSAARNYHVQLRPGMVPEDSLTTKNWRKAWGHFLWVGKIPISLGFSQPIFFYSYSTQLCWLGA